MGFQTGDRVVPRPPKKSWRTKGPEYTEEMDWYVGRTGEFVEVVKGTRILTVRFEDGKEWLYNEEWLEKEEDYKKRTEQKKDRFETILEDI